MTIRKPQDESSVSEIGGRGAATGDVTRLLRQWAAGDESAVDSLMSLVYDELHLLAAGYMRGERQDHTLQPTALVHEAYFRLAGQREVDWQSRSHFYGIAAQAMRRILVDHARRQAAGKRFDGHHRVDFPLEAIGDLVVQDAEGLLALHAALERLEILSPRQSRLVELRFFGGLTVAESAEVLELSVPTLVREWRFARAWLRCELGYATGPP